MSKDTLTVYISGPMSGKAGFNYDLFNATERDLQAAGHNVINPARTGEADVKRLCRKPEWHDYMASAVSRMRHATAILFLEGHEESYGARIEALVAEKMGLKEIK